MASEREGAFFWPIETIRVVIQNETVPRVRLRSKDLSRRHSIHTAKLSYIGDLSCDDLPLPCSIEGWRSFLFEYSTGQERFPEMGLVCYINKKNIFTSTTPLCDSSCTLLKVQSRVLFSWLINGGRILKENMEAEKVPFQLPYFY